MKSKIQKTGRQVVSILIAMAMLIIGTGILPQESVQAAERVEVTDKIHIGVGYEGNSIKVYSSDEGDYVKNIKTSSKNLAAKITSVSSGKNYTFDNKGKTRTAISLIALKKGNYTVSFDVYNNDKKISSHSVKVYANTESGIKNVTIDGKKSFSNYINKNSVKFSVTMNKGYKLKKIVVEIYDKEGKSVKKTVQNNSVIQLGKYPYFYEEGSKGGEYYSMNTSMSAQTIISIYYTDKYSQEEEASAYFLYKVVD